jgi:hypothetical protein
MTASGAGSRLDHPGLAPGWPQNQARTVVSHSEKRDPVDRLEGIAGGRDGIPAPLWVPNRSPMSCDLGIFVYQPTEPITTSEAKLGW